MNIHILGSRIIQNGQKLSNGIQFFPFFFRISQNIPELYIKIQINRIAVHRCYFDIPELLGTTEMFTCRVFPAQHGNSECPDAPEFLGCPVFPGYHDIFEFTELLGTPDFFLCRVFPR